GFSYCDLTLRQSFLRLSTANIFGLTDLSLPASSPFAPGRQGASANRVRLSSGGGAWVQRARSGSPWYSGGAVLSTRCRARARGHRQRPLRRGADRDRTRRALDADVG